MTFRQSNLKRKMSENVKTTQQQKHVSFESFAELYVFIPPDGGWGWIIVIVSFWMNFIVEGTINTFGIFFDHIAVSFDVAPNQVAHASSVMTGVFFLSGALSCGLANRFGFRVIAFTGGVLGSITFFSSSYLQHVTPFILTIGILGGLSCNMLFSCSLLIVSFYFERWRALTTSIVTSGGCIGSMVLPIIFDRLLPDVEWRTKFKLIAGIFLIVGMMALTFQPLKSTKIIQVRRVQSEKLIVVVELANYDKNPVNVLINPDDEDSNVPSTSIQATKKKCILSRWFQEILKEQKIDSKPPSDYSFLYLLLSKLSDSADSSQAEEEVAQISLDGDTPVRKSREHSSRKPKTFRPFYRDDLFYTGSIYVLPEYKSASRIFKEHSPHKLPSSLGYHLSVTRRIDAKLPKVQNICLIICHEAVVGVMMTMLNFRLFKSLSFSMLTLSGFLTMMGYYAPFIFIKQRGKEIGIVEEWRTYLLTIIGVSSTVGTICSGILSCVPGVNLYTFCGVSILIAGTVTIISIFLDNLNGQIVFAALYGFNVTSFVSLRPVIIAKQVGLENLTNAMGLTFLCFGLANFIGVTLSAQIATLTGTYKYTFLFAGTSIFLGAASLFPVGKMDRWEKNKNRRR